MRQRSAAALFEGLEQNESLRSLELNWNGLEERAAVALGQMLRANTALTRLDAKHNRIEAHGAVWPSPTASDSS